MSSNFERLLRDARRALPEPSEAVTRRARERALATVRRRRSLRRPVVAILAVALVGLGAGIGALIAPSSSAAPALQGFGFLPERGWSVFQNGGDGTPLKPASAIAANTELSPGDDSDGLPLSTLQTLPADGVVIVASFIARGDQTYYDKSFPVRTLPLKVHDATRGIEYGVQVRPGRPLGQYQLKAAVNGHNVDVNIYLGTDRPSPALFASAQRQLDRLVVRPESEPAHINRPERLADVAAGSPGIVDRTWVCSTISDFGERSLRVWMASPKSLPTGKVPASSSVGTGSGGQIQSLAGLVAGSGSGRPSGAVYYHKSRCRVTAKNVPLTSRGLPGPPIPFDQILECKVGARVLVRVRALLDRKVVWRARPDFLEAIGNMSTATLAARTEAGKPLVYFTLASGKTRLWTAGGCTH